MFTYDLQEIGVEVEPILPHVLERVRESSVPIEDEVRYLGNA